MQEQDYSFERLRAELLEKLRDQGYSPITITGYRYQCNSIFKWMRRKRLRSLQRGRREQIFTGLLCQTWRKPVLHHFKDSDIPSKRHIKRYMAGRAFR